MRSAPSPPTSDLTFLFTDIEGSTALWDRAPEAMTESLAEHDRRINSIVDAHNSGLGEKDSARPQSLCTMNESCAGVVPSSAKDPAVVVIA